MHSLKLKLSKWTKNLTEGELMNGRNTRSKQKPRNDPRLCACCRAITLSQLLDGYDYLQDFWTLKESAKSCPACALLLQSLQTEDGFPVIPEKELERESDTRISLEGSGLPDRDRYDDTLYLTCGNRIKILDFWADEGMALSGISLIHTALSRSQECRQEAVK